jgi:hypothetical protein
MASPFTNSQRIVGITIKLIRYLNAKGISQENIFKIAPPIQRVQEVRSQIERGELTDFNNLDDPHVAAALLKVRYRNSCFAFFGFGLTF